MKKLAYVAGLFALTCAPLLAALYENLEVGMDKDQVLKTLRRSKQLEGPPTDALLARTGLNGVFKTRQAIGGQTFALNFDYDPSGGLRAVVLYSRSKYRGSEYETRLKSAYKALLVGLTEQFGEPVNMPEWVARESLQEGRIQYMHMWKVSPGVFLMSGLGNMGAMEGYFPLFRFSGPSGMPPKSKRDREELKREWAAIPVEQHIRDAYAQHQATYLGSAAAHRGLLALTTRVPGIVDWQEVRDLLSRRRGLLDGVVICGGEPLAEPKLPEMLAQVKAMGFGVALHTGGGYPARLKECLSLVDWVGFDVKAPFADYARITRVKGSGEAAMQSLLAVIESGVAFECRTTAHPALLSDADLLEIGRSLAAAGVSHYAVQKFRSHGCNDAALLADEPCIRLEQGQDAEVLVFDLVNESEINE